MSDILTKRPIDHAEAKKIAQRLINSHFHQEPCARIGIPACPDQDDDLLILAYIEQRESERAEHDRRIAELLAAKDREVERWRVAEAALAGLLREHINGVPLGQWEGSPAIEAARTALRDAWPHPALPRGKGKGGDG